MTYNVWNKWDTLRTVMLGDCYSPEFFREIANPKIKSALQRISAETQEDLEGFDRVLKEFGCNVIRPDLDKSDSIMNYTNKDGQVVKIPRGPLQPRDAQLVIGNDLFYTGVDHPSIKQALCRYNKDYTGIATPFNEDSFNGYKGNGAPDWPSYTQYLNNFINHVPLSDNATIHNEITNHWANDNPYKFPIDAPSITVVGKDIFLDYYGTDQALIDYYYKAFKALYPNFRINLLSIGGHNDSCFQAIKPGALLSLKEIQTYDNTFPSWDVCYLPDQSWDKIGGFVKLRKQNKGKWWVPGEEENTEFTNFVETWLNEWVGYVEETVFDVNVLVLDEHHVCVSQENNKQVNDFLKKHKMEPVYVPWRHRYFWDGGLHCITLDLEREGTQQDYFPQRGTSSITDYGFDQ